MLPELLEDVPLSTECYRNYWRMYRWQRNVTAAAGGCTVGNGMLPELLEDVPLGTRRMCGLYMIGHLLVLPAT